MSFLGSFVYPRSVISKLVVVAGLAALFFAGSHGYLAPLERILDSEDLTFRFMDIALSPYRVMKALLIVAIFLWMAGFISDLIEGRINKFTGVRASNRALMAKATLLVVYFLSVLIAMDLLGIDLGALAVLGGAIGIGIGFGLQKITSNFISGIILLVEKSVEAGDLLELSDGTQGFIRHTGARYSLIETFDGKEVMVPNEDFITGRVINWTLTNKKGRVEISVGVAYGTDLDQAQKLILEAARDHPRCIEDPEPACYMDRFGESSIDFLLYFWVADVTEGRRQPKSDVLMNIWRKFDAHGIQIPFPQRDLHILSGLDALKPAQDQSA